MEVALTIIFAWLGTAIGSFLNVCIDRLPVDRSLFFPPSHCEACQHHLSVIDLVPVFSFLWLRHRCRYCQTPIPSRLFWVELGTGCLFAFTFWHFGLSAQFVAVAFYGSLFIVIGIIDLRHSLILNKIVYPAAVVALIIDVLLPPPGIINLSLPSPCLGAISGIIGGAIGLAFLLIPYLIALPIYKGEGMGLGDVKMAALMGLVIGSRLILVALLMATLLGGLVGGILILLKIKKRKEPIPFGSLLALATIATLLWGNDILYWYLGLL